RAARRHRGPPGYRVRTGAPRARAAIRAALVGAREAEVPPTRRHARRPGRRVVRVGNDTRGAEARGAARARVPVRPRTRHAARSRALRVRRADVRRIRPPCRRKRSRYRSEALMAPRLELRKGAQVLYRSPVEDGW